VEEVARAYVDAGSQVILTNTFRANRIALEGTDLAARLAEINRAGVAISRRAAGDRAAVFASIGPT
jgi:methionine synthase I (cobalamin-dependent)